MGPRVFTRGNFLSSVIAAGDDLRFNGATRLHAWKLDPACGSVWRGGRASMGPRVFTRGNGRRGSRRYARGSASMGPRVFTRGNSSIFSFDSSSLKALQWGHASSRVETSARAPAAAPVIRFNGATRLHAWKQIAGGGRQGGYYRLQWGHASSRVETQSLAGSTTAWGNASMGPRVFTRGNTVIESAADYRDRASMGPRVFTRGNREWSVRILYSRLLQWGHASSRVETSG